MKLVHWYASVALSPAPPLDSLLDEAPVVVTQWNQTQKDENLVRFGRLWKCNDLVDFHGLAYSPGILTGILTSAGVPLGGYLVGGSSDIAFLVSVCGLELPRAGRGVISCDGSPPKTVHYKTDGVPDRQISLGYCRRAQIFMGIAAYK